MENERKLNYRIGLDIGITSVGWAVLENNSKDEPIRIVDLGVRIFDAAEVPKTGASLAAPRRDARTTRRRLRRRKHRLERIKWLLEQENIIETESFMKRYHSANLPDVYELRYEALERKLKGEELAQVLIHIAKHRGFYSTRKAESKDSETGAVLSATEENKKRMEEKGYRTVGEMIYKDEAFRTSCTWNEKGYILTPRNTAGDYRHTMQRELLEEEVKYIFECQRAFENEKATEELEKKYLEIMLSQRSFDMGPGKQANGEPSPYAMEGFGAKVGLCSLEPRENGEIRGAKGTYTAELFVVLQKINNLRLIKMNGESRDLTEEERKAILELVHNQLNVTYTNVRKKIQIEENYRFNGLIYSSKKEDGDKIAETEKAKFISMPFYHECKKRMKSVLENMPEEEQMDLMDYVGTVLTLYKNDDTRTRELQKKQLSKEIIESLLELNPSKFQHVSLKAMKKIIPFLKEGLVYSEACEKAGYNFKGNGKAEKSKLLKGQEITNIVNEIANPVVKRSVSQTIKVINAIIQKYGSPQAINIELAREMSKTHDERTKLEKQMKERQGENEKAKAEIQKLGILSPTGQDIIKWRLWNDQQGMCMYSGKIIPLQELFTGAYDIDHILPYSITFDDSYRNKVLVCADENRQKGNRTPYEYFGNDKEKWSEFEIRVKSYIRDYRKQQNLLKQSFTKEDREKWKTRNLNDTKYITRVIYNLISDNLELAPLGRADRKKQVMAVNGSITAYMRKRWGLSVKDRSTDTHHAVDAVVIACCTDGMIQKISRNVQGRELLYAKGYVAYDAETGEIIRREDFTREQWDEEFGVQIPKPWDYFKEELDIRMGPEPKNFLDTHRDVQVKLNYPEWIYENIHPIFVSRMPNHKVTGAIHEDTIRSPKHYEEEGIVLTKTPLTSLKLDKDNEIANYYNKESDLLLYHALKKQLLLHGGDAKKAFAEPFHKPKADGTPGNIVNKVKLYDKMSLGVLVNQGNGIAYNANGSMIRVDVFCENGKYYFVPIYVADVTKKRLPNKASVPNKPYDEWKEMKDENFVFSLYSRDLIKFKGKKGKEVTCVYGVKKIVNEEVVYFIKAGISTASFTVKAHDSSYEIPSLGIQNLEYLKKYQVDMLGKVIEVKKEKRMGFQ